MPEHHHPQRRPSILFIGQSKPQLGKVISDVTGISCNPEGVPEKPEWAIDCKYYTATVNVKTGTFQTVPTSKDLVEALVIIFDSKNESSLGALFAYADQLKVKKPDVCLAACENFGEGALETYENVSQFCQEHGFELIELAPLPEHVTGSETANEESARYEGEEEFGPKRILNALLVNPWTGMNRKKWKPPGKAGETKAEGEGEAKEGAAGDSAAVVEKNETEALVDACAAQMSTAFSSDTKGGTASSTGGGSAGASDSSMDDLLTKLKQVKARAANLSDDDRKKYAERVAMSFANAMGVDE